MIGTTILIVDDHRLFADVIASALEQLGARVIGKVGTAQEAIDRAERERPDVVLLDLGLPDRTGIDAFHEIVQVHPAAVVIALTASTDPRAVADVVKAGFHGYVPKDARIPAVVESMRGALEGRQVVIRPPRASTPPSEAGSAALLTSGLTARERQVLELIVAGTGSRAIAEELRISTNTVRTHVQSVLTKLQVHSRLEAAAFAIRHGLVSPGPGATSNTRPDAAAGGPWGVTGLRRTGGVPA